MGFAAIQRRFSKWIRDIESASKRASAGYKQARLLRTEEFGTLTAEREIEAYRTAKKEFEIAVLRPKSAEK